MIQPTKFCTVHELLAATAPPLEVVELLERYEQRQPLPGKVGAWLALWRTLRSDEPSVLDGVQLHPAVAQMA